MSEEEREEKSSPWRWAEVIFGGSVVVYLISATVSGVWWAAALSKETNSISDRLSSIERRFDGLDNVSLGNRVTALEVARLAEVEQRNRMERKIDRLLERRYNGNSAPNSVRNGQD